MEEKELDSLLKVALKVNYAPPDIMPAINEAYLKNKKGQKGKERKRNAKK